MKGQLLETHHGDVYLGTVGRGFERKNLSPPLPEVHCYPTSTGIARDSVSGI